MILRLGLLFCVATSLAAAGDASIAGEAGNLRLATQKGLALVTLAANHWQKNKACFSCHHQTLPMLAMTEAARVGFPLDAAWLRSQADTAHTYFAERIEMLDEAGKVPGGAATTGYGFWALMLDHRPADEVTTAMVNYLLQIQGVKRLDERDSAAVPSVEDGRWIATCRRPPMQASMVGDTVLVLMGMEKYATAEQRPKVDEARAKAGKWLAQAPLRDLQDQLWRLWGLHNLGGDDAVKRKTHDAILAAQRDDGGWAEAKERGSDAFSTGQTLYMLLRTGTAADHPAILRGRDHLLRTQLADGSWHAVSHVQFKAQPYFENGDPHGVDQFLSTAATAWATAALAQLLPPVAAP